MIRKDECECFKNYTDGLVQQRNTLLYHFKHSFNLIKGGFDMGFNEIDGRTYPLETLVKAVNEIETNDIIYNMNPGNDSSSLSDFANDVDEIVEEFNEKGYKLFYHDNNFYVEGIDEIPAEATLIQNPKINIKEFADNRILKMEITGIGISKNDI